LAMPKRRNSKFQTFSGINMTPLMDLTFLLLIVFMITAPVLEYSVDVSPPEMEAEEIEEENSLIIGLNREGEILFENTEIGSEDLHSKLAEISETAPSTNILIRADHRRPYGEVVTILRTAKKAGLSNIALVTKTEE
ncbi:MAG: ExbD/TolR family protein, partial [Verrucomicrobiota bacterium]